MDRKIMWALHALGLAALIAVVVLGFEIYQMLKPQPQLTHQEILKIEGILDEFRKKRSLVLPDQKTEEVLAEDVAARIVIKNYIRHILRNSRYQFGEMTREDYCTAIAEAVLRNTSDIDEAFWFTGLVKTESTFMISARPPKSTNSSARGFCQIIWRYHGTFLTKHGISKDDLENNIDKSIRAGILVFRQYQARKSTNGKRELALRLYRSNAATEQQQQAYLHSITAVVNRLTKELEKELKSA